jgi:hypothetical protein
MQASRTDYTSLKNIVMLGVKNLFVIYNKPLMPFYTIQLVQNENYPRL